MERKFKEFKVTVSPNYEEKSYTVKAVDEQDALYTLEAQLEAIRLHDQEEECVEALNAQLMGGFHDLDLLKKVVAQIIEDVVKRNDYTAIDELFRNISTEELRGFLSERVFEKIFVRISMEQGNVDEVEAFEIEPSITEEADEEWISGSKIFEVSLKKENE